MRMHGLPKTPTIHALGWIRVRRVEAAPSPTLRSRALLLLGRRGCVDQEAMALGELGDGAHVHLQPVLLPHGAHRFFVQRAPVGGWKERRDRKSTRLNSSHANISYAVFCLKKKK